MNILISTWSLQVGGGKILAMNLAAELDRRGHQVAIFNQRAELVDVELVARLLPASIPIYSMADRPVQRFLAYKLDAFRQRLGLKPKHYYKTIKRKYSQECIV